MTHDIWFEISCEIPDELSDIVADFLSELSGSGACVENLSVDAFSPGEIQHAVTMTVKAYFTPDNDITTLLNKTNYFLTTLKTRTPGLDLPPASLSEVRSEDWRNNWKTNFKPLRIGQRLLIVPSWEEPECREGDIVLRLDPGMAFGTGGHETTRLCLELLEKVMYTVPLSTPPSLLDLGTGSGILAMAAARLGAAPVLALDIDPQAIEVARENLEINGLADSVTCGTQPLESLQGNFDIILANILAEELVRLAPELEKRLAPGGTLVLSGILSEKEPLVRAGFDMQPLRYVETVQNGEWVALRYQKDRQA